MHMINVFTILILLVLAGGSFLVLRRLMIAQQPMYPPMEIPLQSPYGPKDDYGRSFYPREGYDVPDH